LPWGVRVYAKAGSAALFAISLVLWSLPNILVSPIAGVLADRWDRRLVMMLSDFGAGRNSLFVTLGLLIGELEVWHAYVATFVNSAFSAFHENTFSSANSFAQRPSPFLKSPRAIVET